MVKPVDHQFNLFQGKESRPVGKVPISAARILEAKKQLENRNGKACADILREIRYGLEAFEKRISIKPKK